MPLISASVPLSCPNPTPRNHSPCHGLPLSACSLAHAGSNNNTPHPLLTHDEQRVPMAHSHRVNLAGWTTQSFQASGYLALPAQEPLSSSIHEAGLITPQFCPHPQSPWPESDSPSAAPASLLGECPVFPGGLTPVRVRSGGTSWRLPFSLQLGQFSSSRCWHFVS